MSDVLDDVLDTIDEQRWIRKMHLEADDGNYVTMDPKELMD